MRPKFCISEQAARRFLGVLIAVEICLVAIFLADGILGQPSWTIHQIFSLDGEENIPAIFSSLQLFLVGILFLSMVYPLKQHPFSSHFFPAILGMSFIFLSFDEYFGIHEEITLSLKHIEWIPRFRGNHGIWVAPYVLAGLVFLGLTHKEFLKIWSKYRRESIIMGSGVVIFLVGVIALEVISYQFLRDSTSPWYYYVLEVAFEEFLEMMGISVFLYGAILLSQTKTE